MDRIKGDGIVTDQEVLDARTGAFEPLLLVQAANGREVTALSARFKAKIDALQTRQMFTPDALGTPAGRARIRSKLKAWVQAAADFGAQTSAASARQTAGIQQAVQGLPAGIAQSLLKGSRNSAAKASQDFQSFMSYHREMEAAAIALLDFMDTMQGRFTIDQGPPANLLFEEQAELDGYRNRMAALTAAVQRKVIQTVP